MAVSAITIDINELEGQRLGYMGISLTNWDSGTPQLASGSKFEDAGGMYGATSDTDLGTVGEFGAIANNTLFYSYFNPSSLDFHYTTTAPTWSTSKQGWYGTGGSATYRYIASIYKNGAGAYTRKNILNSIRSLYKKEYAYETDEYSYSTGSNSKLVISVNTTNLSAGTTAYSTKIFYIKKPISAWLNTSRINGSTYNQSVTYKGTRLSIAQNNGYRVITSSEGYLSNGYPYTRYCLFLTPGKYKLNGRYRAESPTTGYTGRTKHSLYISGAYGLTSMSSYGIIDT